MLRERPDEAGHTGLQATRPRQAPLPPGTGEPLGICLGRLPLVCPHVPAINVSSIYRFPSYSARFSTCLFCFHLFL